MSVNVAPTLLLGWRKCHYCGKEKSPYRTHKIASGQIICEECREWHFKALDLITDGKPPEACQECGTSIHILKELSPNHELRLYAVPKDNIYQVLCKVCCDAYVRKTKDHYRDTRFGDEQKLNG